MIRNPLLYPTLAGRMSCGGRDRRGGTASFATPGRVAHLQAISTKVRGCLPSDAGFTHRDRAREKDRTELRLDEFEADVRD